MANFINGDSGATSGSAGVKIGSDGSNSLAIQTNNVTAITIDGNQNANFVSTGALTLSSGTTAQRPTAVNGMIRYNTSNNVVEVYANSAWTNLTLPVVTPAQVSDQNNTSTGYFSIPIGTTAQRPAGPSLGAMRWNSNTSSMEVFIGSSTWVNVASSTVPNYTVQYLAVAGGGSGGSNLAGAGGGGGGVVANQTTVVSGTAYTITVGAGGAGVSSGNYGANGSNTTIGALVTAVGGGGGGGYAQYPGYSGGSGGGGGMSGPANDTYYPGGAGTSGQGYPGGSGIRYSGSPSSISPGGGGGAGGPGTNGTDGVGGPSGSGGPGLLSIISGSAVYYGGGGGAGGAAYSSYYSYAGSGGAGGGGNGQYGGTGNAGTANTGGGGGGSGQDSGGTGYPSGAGGSGVVIISYPGTQRGNGGTVTYTGVATIHTFTTSGTFTA